MSNSTTPPLPKWKRYLFYAAVLIGLPVTGLAIGEHGYLLAAGFGLATLFSLVMGISSRRCPSCRERLLTISYPASHCPKCGTPYT